MTYEVRLAPAAARHLRKLPSPAQGRVRDALVKLADLAASAEQGARGGKSVKKLQGRGEAFFRLRVGDHRVMYDVRSDERMVLVLGIIRHRDLERWLRGQAQ